MKTETGEIDVYICEKMSPTQSPPSPGGSTLLALSTPSPLKPSNAVDSPKVSNVADLSPSLYKILNRTVVVGAAQRNITAALFDRPGRSGLSPAKAEKSPRAPQQRPARDDPVEAEKKTDFTLSPYCNLSSKAYDCFSDILPSPRSYARELCHSKNPLITDDKFSMEDEFKILSSLGNSFFYFVVTY